MKGRLKNSAGDFQTAFSVGMQATVCSSIDRYKHSLLEDFPTASKRRNRVDAANTTKYKNPENRCS